nr:hypothetical protein BgiMline_033290 [Biomphalaria glabrata]
MLSQLCLVLLIACTAVMSQEQTPSQDPDFEQKLAAAVNAIKEAAKEITAEEGPTERREQSMFNEAVLRQSRGFWKSVGKIAGVAAVLGR